MTCDTTLFKNTAKLFCTEVDEEDPERDGGTLYRKYPPNVAHKTGAMIIVFWLLISVLLGFTIRWWLGLGLVAPFFFFIYYYYFTHPYTFVTIPKHGDCIYIEEELPFAKWVNEAQISKLSIKRIRVYTQRSGFVNTSGLMFDLNDGTSVRLTPPDLSRDQAVMDMIHISRFLELDKTDIHEENEFFRTESMDMPVKRSSKRIESVPSSPSDSSDVDIKLEELYFDKDTNGNHAQISQADILENL